MKAKLKAKITKVEPEANENTRLSISAEGKTDDRQLLPEDTYFHGTLTLKSVVANEMKIGANITIIISDENL